ncbi:sigma-54-dependent Fis family transcriptional regulator, partial [bacterium]|nr:sigma-54-dependent Fis family transcriptional regulator [bacterium]
MPATVEKLSILVCDDEPRFRAMLEEVLSAEGHRVRTVGDGRAAIDELRSEQRYDLVITDMRMPGLDGFAVLDAARAVASQPAVVAITGFASIDETVQAIRHGASDYLAKPFPIDRLLEVVANVAKDRRPPARQRATPAPSATDGDASFGFIGKSQAMRAVYARLLRFAALDATVLVQGETGTGKELAA